MGDAGDQVQATELTKPPANHQHKAAAQLGPSSFWLTRVLLLRALGWVFLFAFLVSAFQARALFGDNGIESVTAQTNNPRPTPVFAWVGLGDRQLEAASWLGVFLSLLLLTTTLTTCLLPLALWTLYLSLVNLRSSFLMSYGWEWQTLETTFLVIFLCPVLPSLSPYPADAPPSRLVLWLLRWLAFRCMLGAGLSKLGGNASACWRDFSCTTTHYLTQPVPNPLAWLMHRLPQGLHKFEVGVNHFAELVAVWGFLAPFRPLQLFAAVVSLAYMAAIATTGNYAFINWITAVSFVASLDDRFLQPFFSRRAVQSALQAHRATKTSPKPAHVRVSKGLRWLCDIALVCFVAYKSVEPVKELMSDSPWLNFYDDYFFVNAHGVFGFINKVRHETVLEYAHDPHGEWRTLDFKCLPGSLDRRPCVITPYHYRLDWDTWIHTTASLESPHAPVWQRRGFVSNHMQALMLKLLLGDVDAAQLVGTPMSELYADGPPKALRATLYLYEFSSWDELRDKGVWWSRKAVPGAQQVFQLPTDRRFQPPALTLLPPHRDWVLCACTVFLFLSASLVAGALQDNNNNNNNNNPQTSVCWWHDWPVLRAVFSPKCLSGWLPISVAMLHAATGVFVFGRVWQLDYDGAWAPCLAMLAFSFAQLVWATAALRGVCLLSVLTCVAAAAAVWALHETKSFVVTW